MIHPGVAGNRVGEIVSVREVVVGKKVTCVVKMPPDIWVGDARSAEYKSDASEPDGEHDQKRENDL